VQSLGCLFSFICPHPHFSPDHPTGRRQEKPRRLCHGPGFQCHLMSTWDLVSQPNPESPLWLGPCTMPWHLAPSSHVCTVSCYLVLSTASLSASPLSSASSSLLQQLFPPPGSSTESGAGLLRAPVPPAEPQPAQLPAAPAPVPLAALCLRCGLIPVAVVEL